MDKFVVSDNQYLTKTVAAFIGEGSQKVHVLTDFDRTLTKAFYQDEYVPSIISILRNGKYLTPDYANKADALFKKYHAIEVNATISEADKKKAMLEWWTKHFELLIKSGLNRKDLAEVITSEKLQLRDEFSAFANLLAEEQIPLVIMSSSGLGSEVIEIFLSKQMLLRPNMTIISNNFNWDVTGQAISIKEPIIHSFNKDETMLMDFEVYDTIKDRTNVILIGDSLGDPGMIEGFNYQHLIKIGYLNDKIEQKLEEYKKNYDVVVLNDGSLNYVNGLLKQILS